MCEGECRTPAWQIGIFLNILPNDKLTATATTTKKLKPVTRERRNNRERGTNKHLKSRGTRWYTEEGGRGAGRDGGGEVGLSG